MSFCAGCLPPIAADVQAWNAGVAARSMQEAAPHLLSLAWSVQCKAQQLGQELLPEGLAHALGDEGHQQRPLAFGYPAALALPDAFEQVENHGGQLLLVF